MELKEAALLDRIGELTMMYENKVIDLRVEITNLVAHIKEITPKELDKNEKDQ